jgi:hypothetical protein
MNNVKIAAGRLDSIRRNLDVAIADLAAPSQWGDAYLSPTPTSEAYGVYRHYKGKLYEVVLVAIDEASMRPVVLYTTYEGSGNPLWMRTLKNFHSHVHPKNPFVWLWKWWQRRLGIAAGDLPRRFELTSHPPRRRIMERSLNNGSTPIGGIYTTVVGAGGGGSYNSGETVVLSDGTVMKNVK